MSRLQHILDKIAEANALIDYNNTHDAVVLSGEALAQSYDEWQKKFNSSQSRLEEVTVMSIAASSHCNALASASQFRDAYSTSVIAVLQITIDGNTSPDLNRSLLSIYSTALYSLVSILSGINPSENGTDREHVVAVTRYIASMLYYYYNLVGKESPSCPYLESAYRGLEYAGRFISIETDTISVNGQGINPATPGDIIGDIIGRSNAIGLFSDI